MPSDWKLRAMLVAVIPKKLVARQLMFIFVLQMTSSQYFKQAKSPILPRNPFIAVWNAPTEQCRLRYKVDLDLSVFDIFSNSNETLSGSAITIFYHNHLGKYPYFNKNKVPVNGGIPQNVSLKEHLKKAKADIKKIIPIDDFSGLGVIDWEDWRPLWDRNWGHKNIYRKKSIQIVKKLHPDWPDKQIKLEAREEYENAGWKFMNNTLGLAEKIRPHGLWGFYLFPDCYNHNYKKNPKKYTGKCPAIEYKRNDKLLWLWEESGALYPSIYLPLELKSSPNALKFVHYRLKEAIRLASIAVKDHTLPVFAYGRPFYAYEFEPLTKIDLVHTIGESAAMGTAGIILWGSINYARSKNHCLSVKQYVDGLLGHYIVNVTSAAKLCSKHLCKNHGRCVRQNINSKTYLHLDPNRFKIQANPEGVHPRFSVKGRMNMRDIKVMEEKFTCQCYEGWIGISCEVPVLEIPSVDKNFQNTMVRTNSALRLPFSVATPVVFQLIFQTLYFQH
ncbi:hyaluronoglucosaminidase 6 isoform X1 [Rhincodon typus]|uniref:hyaluronoglucosaminidase 6 isoform X1 n=2 Tax=Rhincodon typus TaxID=259920 RepID=UPI0009A2C848|nr:hyaluronoglucosaminidase 6 isoform X1 [Rhincodon typus]XP_048464020.1 hyaluronoglucosaminidase 6 isoform X1 [Rhincodon typus]XP_048464021.1 hyaluronoglucosaminidase 6 isoform X1 [Rhincodon typus]XP_048464022.1 hyaluronoglucosaminidase 6 isoform X1 [Rhincodon typus]XP_048464023.1 hyaluronoglucosaminidase 6 isoform X1 [Rhincodon typus]XP_048464024.1 hyaluronoglucosaminidase 6 isoform X1 [Rhincodon typus]